MFCSQCGSPVDFESRFCSKCGVALPGTEPGVVLEPVVIKGVTYTPGTGKFSGFYSYGSGKSWVTIENGLVRRANPYREPPSTGRKVGGVICFVVAGLAGLQSVSWLAGMAELEAAGNQFAGLLAPLILGGLAVTAGFAAAGFVLMSGRRRI